MTQLHDDNSLCVRMKSSSGYRYLRLIDSVLFLHQKALLSESILMMPVEEIHLVQNKTITIVLERYGIGFEFYKNKKNTQIVESFVNDLIMRRSEITNATLQDHRLAFQFFRQERLGTVIALLLFFCIPAVLAAKMWLLALCAVPIIWYIIKISRLRNNISSVAQLIEHYKSANWFAIISQLETTKDNCNDVVISTTLLVDAYIRTKRFGEAWKAANHFPKGVKYKGVDICLNFLKWQNIFLRRIEPSSDEEMKAAIEMMNKK